MGPTASGKSGVAIQLAKKFGGEIISADSRQIYRGLDIGSGKVERDAINSQLVISAPHKGSSTPFMGVELPSDKPEQIKLTRYNQKEVFISEGIRHHLIDVAKPQEDFNVSHFKKLAQKKIEEILQRQKVPIICGGTAFWIDALTKNLNLPEVPPDEILREQLALETTEELFAKLEKLDPERAKNIDSQNKVRLIRAIEICKVLGKVPKINTTWNMKHETKNTKYNFLEIGIEVPREILNEKIKKRLEERFSEGMLTEVDNLHKKGVSWKWMERIGLEYRWIARFLQGKFSEDEMKQKLYFDSIHYAKRQMTWLQRNPNIIWCSGYKAIKKEVEKSLK